MSVVKIYTDGGCSGNPGPGAWAYVLLSGERRFEAAEAVVDTTNNRMELLAVISALRRVDANPQWSAASLEIYTDSVYVQKGITEWIRGWKAKGWKTASKAPVKNVDLWKRLDELAAQHHVDWRWVKGHAGHDGNERADALANRGVPQ